MANELVKALLIEIDGNMEKLRKAVRASETELTTFATKAKKSGEAAGMGADTMAQKQANAARAIASASEMITRQGKVSGEAAKQLLAQGSNIAFAFGPQGAIAGAIGITTLAIIGMFAKTKEEIANTEARALEAMNKFAEMDVTAQAQAYQKTFTGERFVAPVASVFKRTDLDAQGRADALDDFGLNRLQVEKVRLEQERIRAREVARVAAKAGAVGGGAGLAETAGLESFGELTKVEEQFDAVTAAVARLTEQERFQRVELQASAKRTGDAAIVAAQMRVETKGLTDAERERAAALKDLAREQDAVAKGTLDLIQKHTAQAAELATKPIDEMIQRTKDLIAAGSNVPANTARLADLERLKVQVAAVATEVAHMSGALAEIDTAAANGVEPTKAWFTALNTEIERATGVLATLVAGTEPYRQLEAEINKLLERRATLRGKERKGVGSGITDGKGKTAETLEGKLSAATPKARDMADYAREVQQAADGALQLAQNLGGANDETIGLLRSIGQVVGNLPALSEALSSIDANKEGQTMSFAQFGNLASSTLAIAGALSSLFTESAATKAQREELRKNTEAIHALTLKAGLLGFDVSGADARAASGALRGFLHGGGFATSIGGARRNAQASGLNLTELDRIAATYGITLNDNIDSFRQLERALADTITRLGEFGTDLDSQRKQADAEIALRGITDPLEVLKVRQAAYSGRSNALDRVTAGLDLSTDDGRATARANALALFDVLKAGGDKLGAADLGGLTGDELLQALLDLIDGLNAVEGAVGAADAGSTVGAVSGYSSLSAADGARIVDYNRAIAGYAREAQGTRLAMLAQLEYLAQRALAPIPVPPLPAYYGDRGGASRDDAAASAPTVIQVTIAEGAVQQVFHVSGDARTLGPAAADAMLLAVNDALYRGIRRATIAGGNLTIPRGL